MQIKLQGIDEVLATLQPKVFQKALNRSINDIGAKMRTQMTKEVRKTYNIKAKDIKEKMRVKRSRTNSLVYAMHIEGRTLNAMRFGARKLKKRGQVSVRIKKVNGRKVISRAFFAKNGALLQRVKGSKKIRAVQTLSIPQMFNDEIVKDAQQIAMYGFERVFRRNFAFYAQK